MTHFSPDPLSDEVIDYLNEIQMQINAQSSRKEQYQLANKLWTNRKNTTIHQPFWAEIENKLINKHPLPGICQYCEFDRPTATEHFFPKKHFPEKTFSWDNYLLVCHRCNTVKGIKFAVFSYVASNVLHLSEKKGEYPNPPSNDAVLVNPRSDNPQDYLMIDIGTGVFLPVIGVDAHGKARANYTIDLLNLNTDSNLLRYRLKATFGYRQKLEEYVCVRKATTFAQLLRAFPESKRAIVVTSNPFTDERTRLLTLIKNDLQDDLFPCVWREIKAQKNIFPAILAFFKSAPEAATW